MTDRSRKVLRYVIKIVALLAVFVIMLIGWFLFLLSYPNRGLFSQPTSFELMVQCTVTITAIIGYIAFAVWLFKKKPGSLRALFFGRDGRRDSAGLNGHHTAR